MMTEVALGTRPEESTRSYVSALVAVQGVDAVNPEKQKVEGTWATTLIQLGVGFDTLTEQLWLPHAKVEKGWYLLNLECFRRGCRRVPLGRGPRAGGVASELGVCLPHAAA